MSDLTEPCSVCGQDHGRCASCHLPLGSIQHCPMPCICGLWPPLLTDVQARKEPPPPPPSTPSTPS